MRMYIDGVGGGEARRKGAGACRAGASKRGRKLCGDETRPLRAPVSHELPEVPLATVTVRETAAVGGPNPIRMN